MKTKIDFKNLILDILYAIAAGIIVGTAYHFFQNSNGFAPGGVGGLATITYHLLQENEIDINWSVLMIAFNLPIFVLVSAFINKKLGAILSIYILVQSLVPSLYKALGANPYSLANNQEDFNIVFACIATGVISGFGFSLMLKRFGASGGTYGISALIKKFRPEKNIAYVAFIIAQKPSVVKKKAFFEPLESEGGSRGSRGVNLCFGLTFRGVCAIMEASKRLKGEFI